MKLATKVLLPGLLLFLTATTAFSQNQNRPDEGTIGLSASVQSGQTSLMLPIWTSDNVVIAPVLGFVHEQDSFTRLNIGVKPRFYQDLGSDFASYIGVQGLLQYTDPNVGDEVTDFLLGANGGGEYFLSSHFSLGVEGQLNFLFRDDNDNGFSTGAAVIGTYYF